MEKSFSFFKASIRKRLMAWVLALLGAALVLNTVAGSMFTDRMIRESSAELQMEVASLTARRIHALMLRKIERLQDVGVAMTLHPLGANEQKLLGLLLLKNDRAFTELAILDDRGQELLKFSERRVFLAADLRNQGDSLAYQKARGGKFYISSVTTTEYAEPYVTMAVPLQSAPRKTDGVLVAKANLKFLWEVIGASQFGNAGTSYLIDERAKLIAHRDPSLVLKGLHLQDRSKLRPFINNRSADSAPGEIGPGLTGIKVLNSYAVVPDLGWAVVVEEPAGLALADLEQLQRYAVLLLVVGLLLGGVIAAWVSRKITRPIQALSEVARNIRNGNLDRRADIKTGDEIEALANEFNEMTGALQSAYATLEDKVEQRTREVSALYEIASAVNESLDLQIILNAVIAKITEIFGFECTRVFLYDDQITQLELRASFEVDSEHWTGVKLFRRGQGVVGRVAETGEPMIFEDILADQTYAALSTSRATQKAGLRFFAVFPIKSQTRVFGIILFTGRSPRTLTEDEVRLLTSMAEHLGVAVEKASLFGQVETRSRHLEALNSIGAAVSRSLDLGIVLKAAVEKIAATLGFDATWIYQLEPVDGQLHMSAYQGLDDEAAAKMAIRSADTGISGQVMKSGQRLVFEDIQNDAVYRDLSRAGSVRALGFFGGAAFPIQTKKQIIGVLHVADRKMRQYTPEELQLIESIVQGIAVAVENARLFAEVKEKTAELAEANQELVEASRAKSSFIAAMSHELRTPLHIIIGNSELTSDGFFGAVNDDQREAMRKVSRNAQVLLKMINDILALSRNEAKKMALDVSQVEVDEIIANARAHVEQINRDNHLEVRWDIEESIPPLTTDAIKVEEILQNLIGNAFKFTPKGSVEVRVRNLSGEDSIQFSVSDTGIGIKTENLDRIFNEFEQVRDGDNGKYDGVGLGLSIVKKYLQLMHGDIRVESEFGKGTTFTFTVPRNVTLHS
ncbi:MAG: GAF domain-containing protein [Deltaproteobacteria bacterium]|nr:GAF domain-containing protein [Deltaproteobacteria bacterium]